MDSGWIQVLVGCVVPLVWILIIKDMDLGLSTFSEDGNAFAIGQLQGDGQHHRLNPCWKVRHLHLAPLPTMDRTGK